MLVPGLVRVWVWIDDGFPEVSRGVPGDCSPMTGAHPSRGSCWRKTNFNVDARTHRAPRRPRAWMSFRLSYQSFANHRYTDRKRGMGWYLATSASSGLLSPGVSLPAPSGLCRALRAWDHPLTHTPAPPTPQITYRRTSGSETLWASSLHRPGQGRALRRRWIPGDLVSVLCVMCVCVLALRKGWAGLPHPPPAETALSCSAVG